MTMWRKVAIYARVSTGDQTVAQQVDAVRRWIADRAAEVVVFSDEGASGVGARPALQDLMRRARQREFDAVAVWRFDRWARSARELLMWLDECRTVGIEFLSLTEALDTSTPMGRAVFQILAAVAELERSLIAERTKARLDYLRARGVVLGRPRVAVDMGRVRRLILVNGLSERKLARALGVSKGTAGRLRREVLQGRRPKKGGRAGASASRGEKA